MPGGFSSDPTGFVVFTAFKFVGYSAFALYLNRLFPESSKNILLIGLYRTLIGLVFGFVVSLFGLVAVLTTGIIGLVIYILVLIPVRFFEWFVIVTGTYHIRRKDLGWFKTITTGIVWSFLLDVPALLGFFATGGFWIC